MSDYTKSVLEHKSKVRANLSRIEMLLVQRALEHDDSKLQEPELSGFGEASKRFKDLEFGSPEYEKTKKQFEPLLKLHYMHNRHHPEHHVGGVMSMTLIDLVEMFCDWEAASHRNKNGSFVESLCKCCERFNVGIELQTIFLNTMKELGWNEVTTQTSGEETTAGEEDSETTGTSPVPDDG